MKILCVRCREIKRPKKLKRWFMEWRYTETTRLCPDCYASLGRNYGTRQIDEFLCRLDPQKKFDEWFGKQLNKEKKK